MEADCPDQYRTRIPTDMETIISFLNKRHLQLSIQNTDIIVGDERAKNQKRQDEITTFTINGVEINRIATLRYLGVILDDSMAC